MKTKAHSRRFPTSVSTAPEETPGRLQSHPLLTQDPVWRHPGGGAPQPRGDIPGGSGVTTAGPARRGRARQAAAANTGGAIRTAASPAPGTGPGLSPPLHGSPQKEKLPIVLEWRPSGSAVITDWAILVLIASLVSLVRELPRHRELSCALNPQPSLAPRLPVQHL